MTFQGDFERILDWLKKNPQILVVTNIFEKYIELFNCDKNSITIFQTNLNCKYDNCVTQVKHHEYDNTVFFFEVSVLAVCLFSK